MPVGSADSCQRMGNIFNFNGSSIRRQWIKLLSAISCYIISASHGHSNFLKHFIMQSFLVSVYAVSPPLARAKTFYRLQQAAEYHRRLQLSFTVVPIHLISSYRKKFQYIRQANHPAAPFITAAMQLHFCTSSAKHRQKKLKMFHVKHFQFF